LIVWIRCCSFDSHWKSAIVCPDGQAIRRGLSLLSAPTRPIKLIFLAPGEFFVQGPNLQGKKLDEADSEHFKKSDEMKVRDLGAARLHVGEHLAADVHPMSLQACRHVFLVQTQFMAQFCQVGADDVPPFHGPPRFHARMDKSKPGKPGMKLFAFNFRGSASTTGKA
jgi:hypothetical protein